MKKAFALVLTNLFIAVVPSTLMAFHDGGVASCSGCHIIHNSQDGQIVNVVSASDNPYLLLRGTPSDTCLICHADYGQKSNDGQTLGPGGDFYWMTRDVSWNSPDEPGTATIYAREHGHNIDAPGNGIRPDPVLTRAPGGDFNSQYLGCNSCHDPHSNTNFRRLYGVGATEANYPGGYSFSHPAPTAIGSPHETRVMAPGAENMGQHTAYISGMSDWCANCHKDMHSGLTNRMVHPADVTLGAEISNNYNAYVTTSNKTGGGYAIAYLPLVPFEDAANTTVSSSGTRATSKIMCLTCHRAHASPYQKACRWDMGQTDLAASQPANEPYLAQYKGNPLDMTSQKDLCNKCHAKD
ncbi:hypothetical protein HZA56_17495 [Candidatus Poribacteria bacterium]|nr:hypothetical protein [Candidatus Poribacteria bacterium]